MSVLNKMLRDLEQRQPVKESPETMSIAATTPRPLWLNTVLLLGVIAIVFAIYIFVAPAEQVVTVNAMLPEPVQAAPEQQASKVFDSAADTNQHSVAAVVAALDAAPIQSEQEQAIVKTPELAAEEQPAVKQSLVVAEPVIAKPITQPLRQLTSLNETQNNAPAVGASAKNSVQVERSTATVQQRAMALKQQALAESQAGRLQQALQLWQQLQQLTPAAPAVYLAQARLWVQLGQPVQAEQVLKQGLAQGIVDADIQLLLAQQAAGRAQWQKVDTLLPANFELTQQPQYYGLKATALQQLGQQQAALQWFNQLIVAQPQQSRWWLGAAIAYDALANREQANLHYRQALQWGDSLSVASRNYIQQRLAATE